MSPKCSLIKKPYPPGLRKKKRRMTSSEYGKELREKQKLKNWYNLGERQFRRYVKDILKRRSRVEDAAALLIQQLENRLDNVVFRLGFATSRPKARQLVNHGHFMVNGRKVNIPSYQVKMGDKITLTERSSKKKNFEQLKPTLKKYQTPSWLKLDSEKMAGEVINKPSLEEATPPAEISTIFEFYSR